MHLPALLLSLPVALVGIYYLVWAGSAAPLGVVEGDRANQTRVRLRRVNGVVMMLMGIALFIGISRTFGLGDGRRPGLVEPLAWLAVLPLLMAMVVLAWVDIRLTRRMRRELTNAKRKEPQAPKAMDLVAMPLMLGGMLWLAGCGEPEITAPPADPGLSTTKPSTEEAASRPATVTRGGAREPQSLETVQVTLGGETFELMVADEEVERQKGLMFRRSMKPNEGMLFIFPDAEPRGFWMRNTPLPLDIIFLDEQRRILNIEPMAAMEERSTYSAGPAKYAIELGLNRTRRLDLSTGQQVDLPEKTWNTSE